MRCSIKNKKFSCTLDKSRGHIIPNSGGSFKVDSLVLGDLGSRANLTLTSTTLTMSPGLDKITECEVENVYPEGQDIAWCSVIR